ncbi:RHS repeat-associated core domain-containing protein [Pseudomonas sp. IT-P176]|uniref:RHS repeat-associated core domain-containing protein n=1 Tax=Pseudomonas sp. IT-P176 TaxID=3026444 RepID=UPI0039DF63C2
MKPHRETLLCRYHYDPLDRLADCTPTAQTSSQRFYLKERLTTEIQGALQCSIMQHEDQLLAQQQRQNGTQASRLLATDQQRSVLAILDATRSHHLAYAPYGHRIPENGLLSLLGFNGERPDPVTGHYLLGNGYRAFNPVLMRFNSPDSWSPFGEGGLNAYAYCDGDPVNREDPTGHTWQFVKSVLLSRGLIKSNMQGATSRLSSHSNTPNMAQFVILPKTQKPPPWTTRNQLNFSGTEAQAIIEGNPTTVQASLTESSIDPNASQQPYVRTRRNANIYDVSTSQGVRNLTPRFGSNRSIDSTSSIEGITLDPPPPFDQAVLPSYDAAIIHELVMSNWQNRIRRAH